MATRPDAGAEWWTADRYHFGALICNDHYDSIAGESPGTLNFPGYSCGGCGGTQPPRDERIGLASLPTCRSKPIGKTRLLVAPSRPLTSGVRPIASVPDYLPNNSATPGVCNANEA